MQDNDTAGGEELSIEQAAAAYAKATTEEVREDDTEIEDDAEGETTDDELPTSDEDESEEADGESDEDQAEDDEDETGSDQGRFVADNAKVRLPDGTVTTIADLKQGSLRNADYTRKTQEVAEQRRAVESQSERIQASEKQIEQQRDLVISVLKSVVPQPPDPALAASDPGAFIAAKANHDHWMTYLAQLEGDQQRTTQERQAKAAEEERERGNKEWETLVEKVPELKDQKRAQRFVDEALEHGQTYGFSREEIGRIGLDHRNALVLKDAIAWRKLQASKATVKTKVEGRPPVTKGGKRLNPSEQRARASNDAATRLKQSGRVDDAVAAYLALQKG